MALLSRLCLSPPRVSRHRFGRIDALRSLGRIRGIGKDMGNTRTKTVTPALEGPLDRAVRGLFGAVIQLFCSRAYIQELPGPRQAGAMALRAQWA